MPSHESLEDSIASAEIPEELKKVHICEYAYQKAHYIAKENSRLIKLSGKKQSHEIAFWLVSERKDLEQGKIYIRDVDLPDWQTVKPYECIVRGYPEWTRGEGDKKSTVIGWGHSHADFDIFYSEIDDATVDYFKKSKSLGIKTKQYDRKIPMYLSWIINEKEEAPAYRINAKLPVPDGSFQEIDLERSFRGGYNSDPQPKIVYDDKIFTEHDDITKRIVQTVHFDDGTSLQSALDGIDIPKQTHTPLQQRTKKKEYYAQELENQRKLLEKYYPSHQKYISTLARILQGRYKVNKDHWEKNELIEDKEKGKMVWYWKNRAKGLHLLLKNTPEDTQILAINTAMGNIVEQHGYLKRYQLQVYNEVLDILHPSHPYVDQKDSTVIAA